MNGLPTKVLWVYYHSEIILSAKIKVQIMPYEISKFEVHFSENLPTK